MAAVALLRTLASTVDGTSATTAAFTPTAGSVMVAIVAARGTVINPGVVTASDGMTFTLARRVLWGTNTHIISAYVADAASVANSQTLNFNSGADNYSNVCISVHEITGMEKFGLDALLQSGAQANGASGGTPTVVFSAPANTNNPVMFGVAVAANPAGLTEPNGFTRTVNIGAALPDSGLHVSHVDSGFTSDTVTAGGTAASVYGAVAVEFDASSATQEPAPVGGWVKLPKFGRAQTDEERRLERERLGIIPREQRKLDRAARSIAQRATARDTDALEAEITNAREFDKLISDITARNNAVMEGLAAMLAQAILMRLLEDLRDEDDAIAVLLLEM